MGERRLAALALVAFVPLAVTPLALVDQLWLGPAMIGAGLGHDPIYVGLGVVVLLGAALPLAMLALAPAVARGARRAAALAAGLVALAGVFAIGPMHELSPASWLPAGRVLVAAGALLAIAALVAAARRPADAGRGARRELVITAGVLAAVLASGVLAMRSSDAIPRAPTSLLAAEFRGGDRLTGAPLVAAPAPANAGLAPGLGSNIHNDAAMSDSYADRPAIDPRRATLRSFRAAGDCASILFDPAGRLVAVCVGPSRVTAWVLDPATLEPLTERRIGSREVGAELLTDFAGGGYAVLDAAGRLVIGTQRGEIKRFALGGEGDDAEIEPLDEFDVAGTLSSGEPITSALPDASGELWYVGAEGTIGVLDPVSGAAESIRLEGTEIENSFALAPGGGAFVASSDELMRLRIEEGRPAIVWSVSYETGGRQKPGQTSRGTGTTPTVMLGGRYVAITDNAEPRMNVRVYDASAGERGGRPICEVPVFAPGESATENSLIAAGPSLFVENNYGYKLLDLLGGHSSEPGAARIDLDPETGSCEQVWANDEVRIPSVVSKVSAADGTMLTYTKPERRDGVDAWYFTALDAGTGEVLWERRGGTGAFANNHYAALYLGPDGRLYVGTVGGVIGLL